MVEISGIEPLTYAVQVRRSPKLSYIPILIVLDWTKSNERGAERETWTLTSGTLDPKSSASANSAIPAKNGASYKIWTCDNTIKSRVLYQLS